MSSNTKISKRHQQILDIVTEDKKIEVTKLAELINVSQVTARKDLDYLEEKELIKREHGYAILNASDDIANRLAFSYEAKLKIAKLAAESVEYGETVIIESGSCCALLAAELVESNKNITIITNSAFIASYIRKKPTAKIILLGGEYQLQSQVMVGSMVQNCVKNFAVDKLFIGTDGFSEKMGFTGNDIARADTVRYMKESANKLVILTQSEKFSKQGVVSLVPANEVYAVYTDENIPSKTTKLLSSNGIAVKTV